MTNQKDLLGGLTEDATLNQVQDYIEKVVQMRGFLHERSSARRTIISRCISPSA